ncbi:hypothetical protein GN956_G5752 [Arapaima gigas]
MSQELLLPVEGLEICKELRFVYIVGTSVQDCGGDKVDLTASVSPLHRLDRGRRADCKPARGRELGKGFIGWGALWSKQCVEPSPQAITYPKECFETKVPSATACLLAASMVQICKDLFRSLELSTSTVLPAPNCCPVYVAFLMDSVAAAGCLPGLVPTARPSRLSRSDSRQCHVPSVLTGAPPLDNGGSLIYI